MMRRVFLTVAGLAGFIRASYKKSFLSTKQSPVMKRPCKNFHYNTQGNENFYMVSPIRPN